MQRLSLVQRQGGPVPHLQPKQLDPRAYNELRRQGVNLNQIAHRMNALGVPPPPELIEVLSSIRRIIAANVPGPT